MGDKHNSELLFQGYERIEKLNLKLLAALEKLAETAHTLNSRQHAGLQIGPSLWSDLYQQTNTARSAIRAARGTK